LIITSSFLFKRPGKKKPEHDVYQGYPPNSARVKILNDVF
jgi:hypothetical protein